MWVQPGPNRAHHVRLQVKGKIMDKAGYYWVITNWRRAPFVARFDGKAWWGETGRISDEKVEAVSDRLEPPVRFEVETVPG